MTIPNRFPSRAIAFLMATTGACGMPGPGAGTTAQPLDVAPLGAQPASADFGKVALGAAVRQTLSLVNNGADTVDITDVNVVSAYPPDPCKPILIQPCIRPGDSSTLTLECAPTTVGAFGGHVDLAYHRGGQAYTLSVPYSGNAYFNVDLDPSRLFVRFLAPGVDSGDLPINAGNNSIAHPLLLPCNLQQYGSQLDVRYLAGGATVYPQLQSRYYVLPNSAIWSSGFDGNQHFVVDASSLAPLAPAATETAGQASVSAIDQGRTWLFQPTDLPANTTVRHAMHLELFSDAGYSVEVTDSAPLDNNRSVYVRRVCP